ncbi:sugar phosphate isomerase/epimerase [Actinoallomurus vinaceus]|uniref:Sugar phosphate isomerase/epimerase n=1 Tax=Actinoallomurus vinaceus TaxID=1080074 RepID=A0ABP8UU97_9ACTN
MTANDTIRVASAPVNFGIYRSNTTLGPDELLASMADDGYDGTDSGPIGYLGAGPELGDRLARHGLALAGGWVDLRYGDADGFEEDLEKLRRALEWFTSAPVDDPWFAPRPTLACPSNPARFAHPGTPVRPGVPDAMWPAFAARVQRAADACRAAGLEPAFHQHLGTDVETYEEVERLLELTDVGICLDTGHLMLAGGDPFQALSAWAGRITQVHVKDARHDLHAQARADEADLTELVRRGGFCALGEGDLDVLAFARALKNSGYTGWVVVEQDAPATGQDLDTILADQRANRELLRKAGL